MQKKGWFGVGRDDDWGTGSKHFLRELFEKKHGDYNNFFNDILEPLFYEALRTGEDRKHEDYYYSRFNCKIPFLNGGLFDPIGNYDWVHIDILLPNNLFSNSNETKEGDEGDGILDIFDRYNFTVKEDEPLEKEVAIDPELLGKSYEKFNAIRPDNFAEFKKALKSGKKGEENKFNKKFGVYYTPREIVHYMCQQSLINYLDTAVNTHKKSITTKPAVQKKIFGPQSPVQQSLTSDFYKPVIPKKDIETLIHTGEQFSENEARVLSKGRETKTYFHQLPESIRKNAKLLDDKLAEITVCDLAVGSGAFPVGMMSEIVKARNVLTPFLSLRGAQATKQSQFDDKRTVYNFKRQCIEHSLYGVDIDPGAVEIAKLRLWLSLVVDEDDIKNIKPLPNLDYRIMQGNSLISEFMGINFDTDAKKNEGVPVQTSFVKEKTDELIEQFQQKKDVFLNESNVSRKSKLKVEIDDLLVKIFETKLRTQKADYFNQLEDIENKYSILPNEKQRDEYIKQDKKKLYKESGFDIESAEKQLKEFTSGKKIKPFFLWNLYFSEVFHNKSGFDVVITNPPYVGERGNKEIFRNIRDGNLAKYYLRNMDIFYFFFHLSLDLGQPNAIITFITTNYYITATGAKILRQDFKQRTIIRNLVNFNELKIFESAQGQHNLITILQKGRNTSDKVKTLETKRKSHLSSETFQKMIAGNDSETSYYTISQNDLYDGIDCYIRLSKNRLIELLDKSSYKSIPLKDCCDVFEGVQTGANKVFVFDELPFFYKSLSKEERKLIKPFYKNSDIKRYYHTPSNKFLLYYPINFDIKSYSNIYEYLKTHKNTLSNRAHIRRSNQPWYTLLWPRDSQIFSPIPKIVTSYRPKFNSFCYTEAQFYSGTDTYFIVNPRKNSLKFILGIINSKLSLIWLKNKGKIKGGVLEMTGDTIEQMIVPKIDSPLSKQNQNDIESIVNQILAVTNSEGYSQNPTKQTKVKALEAEIDQLVYKLYDLTPEEIKIVEGDAK